MKMKIRIWIEHQLLHVGGGFYRKLGNPKSRPVLADKEKKNSMYPMVLFNP